MTHLDNPASCSIFWVMRFFRFFFSPGSYMGNVAMSTDDLLSRFTRISGIGAQVGMDLSLCCLDGIDRNHAGIQDGFKLADIVTVRPGDDERQRDPTLVYQQMPLAPLFFPDPSDCFQQLLFPGAPSSWLHRCSAIPRLPLSCHRIPPTHVARAARKTRQPATHRNTGGSHSRCQTPLSAMPSIEYRFAVRIRWLRTPSSPESVASRLPVVSRNGDSDPVPCGVSAALRSPRMRLTLPMTVLSSLMTPYCVFPQYIGSSETASTPI